MDLGGRLRAALLSVGRCRYLIEVEVDDWLGGALRLMNGYSYLIRMGVGDKVDGVLQPISC